GLLGPIDNRASGRTYDLTIHSNVLQICLQNSNKNLQVNITDPHPILTFIENAARIDSVGREVVHSAISALLACLEISDGSLQQLQDVANPEIAPAEPQDPRTAELIGDLTALFEDLDKYIFKSVDGAGSTICVSIGVLFVIFVALGRIRKGSHQIITFETGVERVLQALFGLLSIAYRSTGILDVLQEYSGRELDPYAGEPSPDFIEALQELLLTNFIYVFQLLVTESLGESDSQAVRLGSSSISSNSWGELAYSQIRSYIVVKARPKEYYALCVAIKTYGGRGAAKRGVDANSHAIVYTTAHPPAQLENEPKLIRHPIRVCTSSPENKLAPASRVNLGKTYTVEFNSKVKEVGMVDRLSIPRLVSAWKALMDT
ncbi:MAG: hypothetical protein Q9170_006544, partial [Blastenia crenularia]